MAGGRTTVRVLLVDDDLDEHFIVQELLSSGRSTGFQLTYASSYGEGLARLEVGALDVCLLDYHLGERTGLEFIVEAQRRGCTVPIVMLTGREDLDSDAMAMAAGATDYLIKSRIDGWLLERTLLHAIDRAAALIARRQAEQALRRSEERFVKCFYGNPIAMAIETIADGRLIEVNDAFVRLVGLPRDQLLGGRSSRGLWESAADQERLQAELRANGRASNVEASLRHADGERRRVRISGENIEVHAEPCCLLVMDDITEREQMEAKLMLSDRMASIGTLAAGVAHEINNPLAVVVANLELLADGQLSADDQELVDDARRGAERIRCIVVDLRTFSRSDEESMRPVDVRAVLDSALTMVWNELRHRARLTKRIGEVPVVRANEARLGQVFLNLLLNAAQSIQAGAADRHEIIVVMRAEEGGVTIEVCDTGCGIAPDVLPQVFDPFFTTKGAFAAAGLGLTVCHNIIAAFGGRISIRSERGRGTTVTVWLPERVHAAAEGVPPPATSELASTSRRGRLIVVDDEPAVAKSLKRLLGREHDVEIAASGHAALDLLATAEGRYDAVICDVMMPELTGPELFAEVSRRWPGLAERVVFLTGGAFTADARAFLDGVSNAHLEKPVDIKRLTTIVRDLVGRADLDASLDRNRRSAG